MGISSYEGLVECIYHYCNNNNITSANISGFIKQCCLDVLEKTADDRDGIIVLKRDCRVESFDSVKLYNSIANASDEIGEPLTRSDINNIVLAVKKRLEITGRHVIFSSTIRNAVLDALVDFGYKKVRDSFENYII